MTDVFHDPNGNFVFDKLLQFDPHKWNKEINTIGETLGKTNPLKSNKEFDDEVLFFDCMPPISIYENLYLIGYKLVARAVIAPKIYTVTNWVIDEETFIDWDGTKKEYPFPTEINSSYVSFNFLQILIAMATSNKKVPLLINIKPLHYDINFKNRKECDDLVKQITRLHMINELITLNKQEMVTANVDPNDLSALSNPPIVEFKSNVNDLFEALGAMFGEDIDTDDTNIKEIKNKLGYYNNPWVINRGVDEF
jgi:hypothetical protein